MLRHVPFLLLSISSLFAAGCAESTVVQTGQIIVDYDETVDFTQLERFSIVTSDLAPPDAPEPGPDEVFFNELVNGLIVDAMTKPPVCLELIPPDEVSEENEPDVWVANALARTTEEGTYWQCVGGWYWGWWGWMWDPCAWLTPIPVEFAVGNMLIPVGPRPAQGEEPDPVFLGLAQSIAGTGPDVETKARVAVEAIFAQWPVNRTCAP